MGNIQFSWDPRKALANVRKHGVTFEEAQTAFFDEHARLIDDPDHSGEEQRFVLLGYSFSARCLTVSHCYRHGDAVVRMISARKATQREENIYWSLR